MYILLLALAALGSLLLPVGRSLAQADPPAIQPVLAEDFAPMTQSWQPASGRWSVSNGFYTSTFTDVNDIATITSYPGLNPGDTTDTQLRLPEYILRARMFNRGGSGDGREVGFVFGYQDTQNYNEVVADPGNLVRLRTIVNGAVVREVRVANSVVANTWFDFELHYRNGTITVKINGRRGVADVPVPEFPTGQVGLITHSVVGRFDKVFIGVPNGEQSFYENFTTQPFVTFEPQSGSWIDYVGSYTNLGVLPTALALAPAHSSSDYGFAATLTNPYEGAGNLVGLVFNYTGNSYYEAVFSPTGVAKLNRFDRGKLTTLGTASYRGGSHVKFGVALEFSPSHNAVVVDGQKLFADLVPPEATSTGRLGFITHWSHGSFDNVQFHRGTPQPCSFGFSNPPPSRWIVSGTWNTSGGTLNDTTLGANDVVDFKCAVNSTNDENANDFVLRARVLNPHTGAGNRVGLIVNYQDASSFYAGDYYEVSFSGTGVVQISKVINGVVQPFVSTQMTLPRNAFFDVEFHRSGIWGRVKVNGVDLFPNGLLLGALSGGSVGVITHFAKGRFDNVTLSAGGSNLSGA